MEKKKLKMEGQNLKFQLSDSLGITWSRGQTEVIQALNEHDEIIVRCFHKFGMSTAIAGMLASFKEPTQVKIFFHSMDSKRRFLNILAPLLGLKTIDYRKPSFEHKNLYLSMNEDAYKLFDLLIMYDADQLEKPELFFTKVVPLMQVTQSKVLINLTEETPWMDMLKEIFHVIQIDAPAQALWLSKEKVEKLKILYSNDPTKAIREDPQNI